MGPFPSFSLPDPASSSAPIPPRPFHILNNPFPPAHSTTPLVFTTVPQPIHMPSDALPPLVCPHVDPSPILVGGLVPASGSSSGHATAISGQKRVFVDDLAQPPPSRAAVSCGLHHDSPSPSLRRRLSPPASSQLTLQTSLELAAGPKGVFVDNLALLPRSLAAVACVEKPSPPLRRRFSPLASPRLSLQARMELAASSLTDLRNSAPGLVVLPPVLDVSVTSSCMVHSPLAPVSISHLDAVSSPVSLDPIGISSPAVVPPVDTRKSVKVTRKSRSVTHIVSPDVTKSLGAGSVPVCSISEAAGSSMPPPVP
jgi:hypothetical protein